ncbi:MAG: VWA-like domain-containing protein [Candidatus Hermodarchaeota archaeon]
MESTEDANNMSLEDEFTRARVQLLLDHPFYGFIATHIKLEENKEIKRVTTDGQTLFYNPAYIKELDFEELKTVIAQIILYIALDHIERRGDRDPQRWDVATDFAVNPILLQSGFKLPEGSLIEENFEDLEAEAIYDLLTDDLLSRGRPLAEISRDTGAIPTTLADLIDEEESITQPLRDYDLKRVIIQALQVAKKQGNVPLGLERRLGSILNPDLPWEQLLTQYIYSSFKDDWRWIPNRRFIPLGITLPSTYSESLRLVVAIDTSGSVSDIQLNWFLAEIKGIIATLRQYEILIFGCDAAIQDIYRFETGDSLEGIKFTLRGKGGTDFRPIFDYIEEEQFMPDCLVYFTDAYGTFPEMEPTYPVIWVVSSRKRVPWGTRIQFATIRKPKGVYSPI